jgi:hypothetical protein
MGFAGTTARVCDLRPASIAVADPHRFVRGFQGLVHDTGQIIADRVQGDRLCPGPRLVARAACGRPLVMLVCTPSVTHVVRGWPPFLH